MSAFLDGVKLCTGSREDVVAWVKEHCTAALQSVVFFDASQGRAIDPVSIELATKRRGAGRPPSRLETRSLSLLPSHWDWLEQQPGGPIATIDRLVAAARKEAVDDPLRRDAVYRFINASCRRFPGFEQARRAIYTCSSERFIIVIEEWPADIVQYVQQLLGRTPALSDEQSACEAEAPLLIRKGL